jgi:glutathione synthase/RimK-type ligase-like ATP-grasp enzyme
MTKVAVLTPNPTDLSYAGQWPDVLARLSEGLTSAGIEVHPTPWTDHVDSLEGLEGYDLILPVITWGYHRDHKLWLKACALWEASDLPFHNPARVIQWNSDKAYLARLAAKGVTIPPTLFTDTVTPEAVEAAFAQFNAPTLIVKPTVSAGAYRTLKIEAGDNLVTALSEATKGPAMIQPFLPTIASKGETSLLFFGGAFNHAVNKRPGADGEFRIQVQFGGLYQALDTVPEGAMTLALKTLEAIGEPLLYARIDMVPDDKGQWCLMEAELIEPDFYLAAAPEAGLRFGEAVRALLK